MNRIILNWNDIMLPSITQFGKWCGCGLTDHNEMLENTATTIKRVASETNLESLVEMSDREIETQESQAYRRLLGVHHCFYGMSLLFCGLFIYNNYLIGAWANKFEASTPGDILSEGNGDLRTNVFIVQGTWVVVAALIYGPLLGITIVTDIINLLSSRKAIWGRVDESSASKKLAGRGFLEHQSAYFYTRFLVCGLGFIGKALGFLYLYPMMYEGNQKYMEKFGHNESYEELIILCIQMIFFEGLITLIVLGVAILGYCADKRAEEYNQLVQLLPEDENVEQ